MASLALPRSIRVGDREVFLGWADAVSTGQTSSKRKLEFDAGRLAARRAIGAAGVSDTAAFQIVTREDGHLDSGRPLVVPASLGLVISISHSSGHALAAVSSTGHGGPIGIDLEPEHLDVEASFASEAFAVGELDGWSLVPTQLAAARVSIAWAAKEAALKVWGIGLRAPLGQVALQPQAFLEIAPETWVFGLHIVTTLQSVATSLSAAVLRRGGMTLVVASAS